MLLFSNAHRGCDANIFLLFNNFFDQQVTEGFKFSGLVKGGACDADKGEGYAVVADQGNATGHSCRNNAFCHEKDSTKIF